MKLALPEEAQTTEVRRFADGAAVAGAWATLWREADGIRVWPQGRQGTRRTTCWRLLQKDRRVERSCSFELSRNSTPEIVCGCIFVIALD